MKKMIFAAALIMMPGFALAADGPAAAPAPPPAPAPAPAPAHPASNTPAVTLEGWQLDQITVYLAQVKLQIYDANGNAERWIPAAPLQNLFVQAIGSAQQMAAAEATAKAEKEKAEKAAAPAAPPPPK